MAWKGHHGPVFSVNHARDNDIIITAGADGRFKGWTLGATEPLLDVKTGQGKVLDVHVERGVDATVIITAGGDGTIKRWQADVASGSSHLLDMARVHERTVEQVLVSKDGTRFSVSSDGTIRCQGGA